jgi:hypothetical protein
METIYWGTSGWKFLHLITFLYPESPDTGDKILMREFLTLLNDILPCKYCRASFNKYSVSLDLIPHLESRELIITWLYKMHNKVNKKLRSQGFCKNQNPTLEYVYKLYEPQVTKIHEILKSHKTSGKSSEHSDSRDNTKKAINYICDLGREFLGSIVFNYQGYFTNCHTSDEKSKIAVSYHRFFNVILPLLRRILHPSYEYKLNTIKKFRIRSILQQNESYTRLKRWFFECSDLCQFDNSYEDYETEFNKHIVWSCNNPKADNVKSCRKVSHSRKITKKTKYKTKN